MLLPLQLNNLLETAGGVEVNAGVASLTLTTLPATVEVGTDVNVGTVGLTLTTHAAEVTQPIDVNVGVVNLSLTTYAGDIEVGTDVNVGTASLTLTTYAADVDVGQVEVDVGVVNLSLQTYPATIDAVFPSRKGGRVKKRRTYTVTIDGEAFTVPTLQDVVNLLDQAKEVVEDKAERIVQPNVRPKPPKIEVRTASGQKTQSQRVQRAIRDTESFAQRVCRQAQARVQRQREVDSEISTLIQRRIRQQDDEEAIIALLM